MVYLTIKKNISFPILIFSNKQTVQLRVSTRIYRISLQVINLYLSVQTRKQSNAVEWQNSPRGFQPLSAENISVAIISVIRRLIVPDRSSIHERAVRLLFYSILIWAMDKTLTDTAALLRVRFSSTTQSRVGARIKGSS